MPVEEDLMRAVLLTFGTAMVPVLELRGAIPVGVAAGLSPAAACAVSVLGNMVPVPFILLLIRRIFDFLRGTRLFGPKIQWLERRAHLKGRVVRKYRLPGLIILVAIPLPGTGAWTGALVAALLCWTSACATRCPPSSWAWSSPAPSSPPSPTGW